MNAVFAACGISGWSSVRAIRIANLAPRRARDEPLVAVDDPVVAVADGARLDERRVGAGDLGLGHREARAHDAVAEGLQVLLLLRLGRPVEERVHVALVGRLGVESVGTEGGLRGLGRDGRHGDVSEAHPAVLLRHVREPEAPVVRGDAHLDDRLDEEAPVALAGGDLLLGGSHDLGR